MGKRVIELEIIGDVAKLNRSLAQAEGTVGKFGNSAGDMGTKWSRFSGIAKAAAVGGIAALAAGLKGSIDAAKDAQVSQVAMETQLNALNVSYRDHAKEIDNVIGKVSKLSGLDDEDLQGAFTSIVRVTGDVTSALQDTGIAADFARAKHIDVAKAGEIVAKVAGGNTGILSRYGVTIDKNASSSEALAALQSKFAGQAQAYGETASGAQDRFKVATENLQEAIGTGLLPILTKLANGFADIVGWFEEHKTAAIFLIGALGTLGGAMIALKIADFAKDISALVSVVRGWAGAQVLLNIALAANPLVLVVGGLALLAGALYLAWTKSETFRNVVTGAFNTVKDVAETAFGQLKTAAENGLLGPIGLAITRWRDAKDTLGDAWDAIKGAAETAFNAIKGVIIDPIRDAAGWIVDKIGDLAGKVGNGFRNVRGAIADVGGSIYDAVTYPFRRAYDAIAGIVGRIGDLVGKITSLPSKALKALHIPGFAAGTSYAPGGLAIVGERGPELIDLPRGSRVHAAGETRGMLNGLSDAGGQTIIFNGPVGSQRAARVAAMQLAHGLRYS